MRRKISIYKIILIYILILSLMGTSGCIYYRSPEIIGLVSDEFGNDVYFNESSIFMLERDVIFDLDSETIKVKVMNKKTREPIEGAQVTINWNWNPYTLSDNPIRRICLLDTEYTNSEGEVLFLKSNARRIEYSEDTEGIDPKITAIKIDISYKGTYGEITIREKDIHEIEGFEYLPLFQVTLTNSIGMEFVQIPEGEFYMGSVYEKPYHRVVIPKAFFMSKYEVTQGQWREVMGGGSSQFNYDNLPVTSVNWYEVQEFIKNLNEKEGANIYRLPSEAEWEYAARAGTTSTYSFGERDLFSSKLGEYAWYRDREAGVISGPHMVGLKKPNLWGLYDMHGNVFEWVQDTWHDSYDGAPTDGSAWESEDNFDKVVRGGSFASSSEECRSAYRSRRNPISRSGECGFRLVMDLSNSTSFPDRVHNKTRK